MKLAFITLMTTISLFAEMNLSAKDRFERWDLEKCQNRFPQTLKDPCPTLGNIEDKNERYISVDEDRNPDTPKLRCANVCKNSKLAEVRDTAKVKAKNLETDLKAKKLDVRGFPEKQSCEDLESFMATATEDEAKIKAKLKSEGERLKVVQSELKRHELEMAELKRKQNVKNQSQESLGRVSDRMNAVGRYIDQLSKKIEGINRAINRYQSELDNQEVRLSNASRDLNGERCNPKFVERHCQELLRESYNDRLLYRARHNGSRDFINSLGGEACAKMIFDDTDVRQDSPHLDSPTEHSAPAVH